MADMKTDKKKEEEQKKQHEQVIYVQLGRDRGNFEERFKKLKEQQIKAEEQKKQQEQEMYKQLEQDRENLKEQQIKKEEPIMKTYIPGFDELFAAGGIPKRNSVLVAGGTGTGKSTFCRQICYNLVTHGKHCMYVSFEESKEKIERSMSLFGWDAKKYIDSGHLVVQNINPLDILRMKFGSVSGSGSATELSYKIKPLVIPKDFNPEIIVVDSLTAVISASISKEKNYRIYLQQLFNFFEESGATSFLITETEPIPTRFSETGIEEFLADGILVLYNIQRGDRRENAIEVLKMRYSNHQKKVFSLDISAQGIKVYPERQVMLPVYK